MLGDLAGRFLGRFVADDDAEAVGFDEADVLNPGGRSFQPDLSGFGVAAVASADDEVGRFALQCQGEGLRGGKGVAAGQRAVGEQHGAVGAQGVALGQPLCRVGRPHGQGDHAVSVAVLEVNGHVDAQQVEGVDFRRDTLALDDLVFVVELYAGNDGDVFHADCYFHGY